MARMLRMTWMYDKKAILKNLIFAAGRSSTNFIRMYVLHNFDIHK